jgi:hypothetical protein
VTAEAEFPWGPPAGHNRGWITIELDHPVNPWEHDGAGSISWRANFHRLAPHGDEAVSIIKEAWERREDPRDQSKREEDESEPIDRAPVTGVSIKPGWAEHIEFRQYWVHLALYRPVNERWEQKTVEGGMEGELVNDGIVERAVTVEATTNLGRRALRIIEALHSAHPHDEQAPPKLGPYPWG